jgi:YHS domain-containing protein
LPKEHGKTVVAVTHDHRIEDVADRVLWLEDGHLSDRRPELNETATDPVCGMTIDPNRAAGSRQRGGRTLHFCSDNCLDRFDSRPDAFAPQRTNCCYDRTGPRIIQCRASST